MASARDCYQRYLALVPKGAVADQLRVQLEILRSMLN
jgi:hypothetical protein